MKRPRGRWAKWYASVLTDKRAYPDTEFRAFASLVARAADVGPIWKDRQAVIDFLDEFVDGSTGAELVAFLIARDDLHVRRGGRVELMGFAELHQRPVDTTAADRQRRRRERLAAASDVTAVRGDTPPIVPSPPFVRHGVTSTSDSPRTPPPFIGDAGAEAPAIAWLAGHDALVMPNGNGLHRRLMDDAERHGAPKLVTALERVYAAGGRTAGQLVLGASNFLNPIPKAGSVDQEERAAESRKAREAALARTAAMRREQEEWDAESGVADASRPAQDTPRRVGALLHRPTAAGN